MEGLWMPEAEVIRRHKNPANGAILHLATDGDLWYVTVYLDTRERTTRFRDKSSAVKLFEKIHRTRKR